MAAGSSFPHHIDWRRMEEATLETLSGVKSKAVRRPSLLKVILPNTCAPILEKSHTDAATKAAGKCTQQHIISRLVQSCRMMQFERHWCISFPNSRQSWDGSTTGHNTDVFNRNNDSYQDEGVIPFLSPGPVLFGIKWVARKTLDSNDRNQVAYQRFSLKLWFAAGAYSYRLRKTGPAHCYTRISKF